MKERLVEDWLIRINERGYEVSFCQILLAKGFRVLRCGHSPTEHGKDILAIAPDGSVYAYQLKTGDFAQADVTKHHDQINMLVEARPIHPGLPASFDYRPFLVTTGEFKDPAISLIKELNAGWQQRDLPALGLINGRQLHVDLVALSSDFWPVESPAIRRFRELYLVDGRGDLDVAQFARFLIAILRDAKSGLDLERRVAAANIFAGYLLDAFYQQNDYWSVFRGWTICASQIAWAGESNDFEPKHWEMAFGLARDAALNSLKQLSAEVSGKDAFRVYDRELDDFTRTRNTLSLAGAACWQLLAAQEQIKGDDLRQTVELIAKFIQRQRVFFWGEGALSQFLVIIWLLERGQQQANAKVLLASLIEGVSERNARESNKPYEDPYVSPDDCLVKLFKDGDQEETPRRQVIESYSLFPMLLLAVRRDMRAELEKVWLQISRVTLTWFEPTRPVDVLLWFCDDGKEYTDTFAQPQSWKVLRETAFRDRQDRLPRVLREDLTFSVLFMLAFPHRTMPSLIKHLDNSISSTSNS